MPVAMSHKKTHLPAPCIIESGIIVNKDDIRRLLNDLNRVRYIHTIDGEDQNEGEGWMLEVFSDPNQATLVANDYIYINIESFDYLSLKKSPTGETYFDLTQDTRRLRLIPIKNSDQIPEMTDHLDVAALEEMLTQVLSAKWDVQLDEDNPF